MTAVAGMMTGMTTTAAATTATGTTAEAEMTDVVGRMRRGLGGIRVRIVVGWVVLLAIALAIVVTVVRQVQLARLDREIERELAQEVEELRLLAAGTNPATGQPFGGDVQAIFDTFLRRNVPSEHEAFYALVDGRPFQRDANAPAVLLGDGQLVAGWAGATEPTTGRGGSAVGEVRWLAVPLLPPTEGSASAGVFVVTYFPDDEQAEVNDLVWAVVLAGLGVLAISTAVAWSVAGRVVRPVRDLTRTARRITDSDLSARIPVEGHDELAELGTTFNDMVDRLDQGFRAQRQFLDDVAHELRTPITIARGHLEVLGDDPAERAETIAIVTDELDRMNRYVSDLRLLAQAEQPDFLSLGPVDPGELVAELFDRVRALGPRAWTLDCVPPAGAWTVLADSARLEQAVLNLAANAVQHTTDGAEIGTGGEVAGVELRLWVRDSGPGVDPAVAETLFRRHARGASSRAQRPEGMGIGLSIVDAIARAHGGLVEVHSEPGRGATFTLRVPVTLAPSHLAGPPLPPPNHLDTASRSTPS